MRGMRQVIKTNQNFVTGEHYEQRVLKPIQMAHNRVTVQLHDATSNKLIEEATTENAVSSVLESRAYHSIATMLNGNNAINGIANYTPFASIVLSDSDLEELQDPYFVHGSVSGVCNRTDTSGSGDSAYKGMYNSAESYQRNEDGGIHHIHLVYDWSTSAGNGKIQTISWLGGTIGNYTDGRERTIEQDSTLNYQPGAYGFIFDRHGNLYKKVNDKYYKVLNMTYFINGMTDLDLASTESYFKTHEVNGYYYTCSYAATGSGTTFAMTMTINKVDFNGNVVDTWTEDLISGVPQLVEARTQSKLDTRSNNNASFYDYCDFDGWIGVAVNYSTYSNGYALPTYSNGAFVEGSYTMQCTVYTYYNVLTKQWLRVPNPWDAKQRAMWGQNRVVLKKIDANQWCSSGELVRIDPSISDLHAYQYCPTYLISMHSSLPVGVYYYPNNSTYNFNAIAPICAQTRLASPITKTSLNTMKIQYDFSFKVPLGYMTADHVWDIDK